MLAAMALTLLVACGGGDDEASPGSESDEAQEPTTISFRALDFGFDLEQDRYPAGPVELVMKNEGAQAHQAVLYLLNDGVDFEEFKSAVMKDQSVAPQLAKGQLNGIRQAAGPGEESSADVFDIEAGTYMFICWLPDQSLDTEKNHAELGMIEGFTIE